MDAIVIVNITKNMMPIIVHYVIFGLNVFVVIHANIVKTDQRNHYEQEKRTTRNC